MQEYLLLYESVCSERSHKSWSNRLPSGENRDIILSISNYCFFQKRQVIFYLPLFISGELHLPGVRAGERVGRRLQDPLPHPASCGDLVPQTGEQVCPLLLSQRVLPTPPSPVLCAFVLARNEVILGLSALSWEFTCAPMCFLSFCSSSKDSACSLWNEESESRYWWLLWPFCICLACSLDESFVLIMEFKGAS